MCTSPAMYRSRLVGSTLAGSRTRLPTAWTSYVVSGLGTSARAMPVCVGPYGAGAWANSSSHVSALAGKMATVSAGTMIVWPLSVMVPPQWAACGKPLLSRLAAALVRHAWSSVAACRKPVMSNCVLGGRIGNTAADAGAWSTKIPKLPTKAIAAIAFDQILRGGPCSSRNDRRHIGYLMSAFFRPCHAASRGRSMIVRIRLPIAKGPSGRGSGDLGPHCVSPMFIRGSMRARALADRSRTSPEGGERPADECCRQEQRVPREAMITDQADDRPHDAGRRADHCSAA